MKKMLLGSAMLVLMATPPLFAQQNSTFNNDVVKCINKHNLQPDSPELRDILLRCENEAKAADAARRAAAANSNNSSGSDAQRAQWQNCLGGRIAQFDDGISSVGDVAMALQNECTQEFNALIAASNSPQPAGSDPNRTRQETTKMWVAKLTLMWRAAKRRNTPPVSPPANSGNQTLKP